MKRYLAYLTVCAAIFAAGCSDFGSENQLSLPDAPAVAISSIVAEEAGDSITFTVAPTAGTGFYSWVVIQSEAADSTITADHILKKLVTGVANGVANYAVTPDTIVGVGKLTPFEVYQIYAVAASVDGIVSAVKVANIRTLDDGSAPSPQSVAIADTTVTLTFHEPLQLGTGKVFVSYFAINTLTADAEGGFTVEPDVESFNPQDIEIPAEALSIAGNALVIELSDAPAGAYASITYEENAVLDLEGNGSSAFTAKASNFSEEGEPSGLTTVHLANKAWALSSEFEDPETVSPFVEWEDLVISAVPEEGITIFSNVPTVIPTVIYKQPEKTVTINVSSWGTIAGIPAFLLPEAPARGAIIDLNVPAGAFEDVYGNTSKALTVESQYLYSYGYTLADVLGTYEIEGINASTGAPIAPETVIIVEDEDGEDENAVLIKNLAKNITGEDSEVEAVFDPITGTLIVPDWQILAVDWTHPTAGITADVFFSTSGSLEIIFAVTSPGKITSASEVWGYYLAKEEDYYGALIWYDPSSAWTRTSTATSKPSGVKANVKTTKQKNTKQFLKHREILVK
ncbi:MAG: hypothetical protein LBS25_09855 [Candidatus Symbiothrix sp.]|jgi:hypothetical protein|nr:hypothetical protein [Candidatus Symbiothrix sp.]